MTIGSNILLFVVVLQLSITILILFLIFRRFTRNEEKKSFNFIKNQHQSYPRRKKYANSGISEALAGDLKEKIVQLMEKDKVYLDADLKLKDLAGRLGLSIPNTSQIINQNLNKDFNTLINEYRIDAAIDLLEEDSRLTLASVAYEVGFNNNVTFYKAFKKYKGKSPSEYLKEIILNTAG